MMSSATVLSSPRDQQAEARALARQTPASFAYVTTQGRWLPFKHLLEIDRALVKVATREITRLIVQAPVRHGKSELASRYFPAWYLGRHPDHQVMLASYEATLARSWGRKARDELAEHGPDVFGVSVASVPAASEWWTVRDREGVMVTAGVGGSLTGKGADVLIIDDPVKNAEEAHSETMRNKVWDWWRSTARSRLQPNGAVVVIMARWHEDDFVARLLADNPDEWTVLDMPAVAETNDALGRMEGEALCPEMFDRVSLRQAKRELGSYWFSALYQQRPAPPEGLMFKRSDFRYYKQVDGGMGARFWVCMGDDGDRRYDTGRCPIFQTADVAASDKTTADFTVVATWCVTADHDLLLLDVQRQHFETLNVKQFLASCNANWGGCPQYIEEFGAGKTPLRMMRDDGYAARGLKREEGTGIDKIARSMVAIARFESHKVFFPADPRPAWLDDYESELTTFPNGAHDDQVDVTSYAARLARTLGQHSKPPVPSGKTITGGMMTDRF
jgi:predicted phage terminase large subunit-like protein